MEIPWSRGEEARCSMLREERSRHEKSERTRSLWNAVQGLRKRVPVRNTYRTLPRICRPVRVHKARCDRSAKGRISTFNRPEIAIIRIHEKLMDSLKFAGSRAACLSRRICLVFPEILTCPFTIPRFSRHEKLRRVVRSL